MSRTLVIGSVVVLVTVVAIAVAAIILLGDDGTGSQSDENGDPVALGETIYRQQCFGCHTTDGSSSVGPTFEGLYGSEVTMDDGSIVVVDEDHLRQAIADPRATTRQGYPDVMPPFTNLSDDEIAGLVAFIQSLE